jgi:hypothetical protein
MSEDFFAARRERPRLDLRAMAFVDANPDHDPSRMLSRKRSLSTAA